MSVNDPRRQIRPRLYFLSAPHQQASEDVQMRSEELLGNQTVSFAEYLQDSKEKRPTLANALLGVVLFYEEDFMRTLASKVIPFLRGSRADLEIGAGDSLRMAECMDAVEAFRGNCATIHDCDWCVFNRPNCGAPHTSIVRSHSFRISVASWSLT